MSAAEDGALAGLIVALIPGIRIKLGKPTLNKGRKDPLRRLFSSGLYLSLGLLVRRYFSFRQGHTKASRMSHKRGWSLPLS